MGEIPSGGFLPKQPSISRRQLCGAAAGLAVVPLAGIGSRALAADLRAPRNDIRYVLTDARHPESLRFGAVFEGRGAVRLEVTDGLTKIWREALVPLWRQEGGSVAGLTQRPAWVCIAEQARSFRRRSILSARHLVSTDGVLREHFVSGPPSTVAEAAVLQACGSAWPAAIADLALHCPAGGGATFDGRFPLAAASSPGDPASFLVSWIIA